MKQVDTSTISNGRLHVNIVANLFIIWLDEDINDSIEYYQNFMSELSQIANMFKVFTNRDQSIDFLTDILNENISLIISEEICQHVVPYIHNFDQLQSIFIVQKNQNIDEEWVKNCSKVKGVYAEISTICDVIRQTAKQCQQNTTSFNLLNTTQNLSEQNLNQLNPMFMYSQILKEIILEIEFEEQYFTEFIDYCREVSSNNDVELKNIEKFQQNYRTRTAIEWYTSERFLYTALNRGLRIVDTDTIIKMGCFIVDLHQQIEQLHKTQYPFGKIIDHLIVYRGQVIPKIEFEKIQNTSGGLIAFNSFLSTSRKHEVSCIFAGTDQIDPELVSVIFVITADPSKSSAAFASIKDISQFLEEDEILFTMHAIFRIKKIKSIYTSSCCQFEVEVVLTNDTDQDLDILQRYIQKQIPSTYVGWEKLTVILLNMGETEKAQRINISQESAANTDHKRLLLYFLRGMSYQQQGEYRTAVQYYEKALAIRQQYHLPNLSVLIDYYTYIGGAYFEMGDYSKALIFCEKVFAIHQQSLHSDHPDFADSNNHIGLIYCQMGDYSKALVHLEKALTIQKQSLPSNHPHLANSYSNIGNVYFHTGEYSKALKFYERALAIKKQSLPSNHPDLANSYNSIGLVYYKMDQCSKALEFYEKALAIRQQSLLSIHPSLAKSYNHIGLIYCEMGDYSKALVYHGKALAIQKQSLPSNHPDLASSYSNIGYVYSLMGDYSKALPFYERALPIRQQSLSSNHPQLASSYNNIGLTYCYMGDYSKALVHLEKALAIQQQSLPSNHPDLASSYNNIAKVYSDIGDYFKGRLFMKHALKIAELSFPSQHSTVKMYRRNMENLSNIIS